MIGTVTKIGRAKSGKHIVYFDNKHGQTDGYLVSEKCSVPPERATIDADCNSWNFRDHTFWGLNAWKEVKGAPVAPATPAATNGGYPPVEPPVQAGKGWDIQSGDLSRYASNIVASAITAGLIKDPHQIMGWAAAAYTSGNSLREGLFVRKLPSQMADFGDPNENQDRDPDDPGFTDPDIPF